LADARKRLAVSGHVPSGCNDNLLSLDQMRNDRYNLRIEEMQAIDYYYPSARSDNRSKFGR
jgi:hypothetical protein